MDPLALFWVHEVVIERFEGPGQYGDDDLAYPVVSAAFVSDGLKITRDADSGDVIASTARVALPPDTPPIPVRSRVTLPPEFGSRVTTVQAVAVADAGDLPTPNHIELTLA